MNMLPVSAEAGGLRVDGFGNLVLGEGATEVIAEIGVRSEDRSVCNAEDSLNAGTVSLLERLGEVSLVHLDTPARAMVVNLAGNAAVERGQELSLDAPTRKLHMFDADSHRVVTRASTDSWRPYEDRILSNLPVATRSAETFLLFQV